MAHADPKPSAADDLTQARPTRRQKVQRVLLASVGIVATVLALIGLFVPVLPTTPLLLLSAACFMRSSDRLYRWLTGNRWFGPIIRNYRAHRAIPRRTKALTLVFLWAGIGSSVALADAWWVRSLLLTIAVLVTLHVARLRSVEDLDAAHAAPAHDRGRPQGCAPTIPS